MRARVYEIEALSPPQIEAWDALLAELRIPSPFLSHAYSQAINDTRGKVRVLQFEDDGGISGFLPFQLKPVGGLLGHAEKAGGPVSDMFGVVGACNDILEPDILLRCGRISSLRFDHGVPELCPFPSEDSECKFGVRVLVDDFAVYMESLKARDKDFVKTVERGRRQLERDLGAITFAWHAVEPHQEVDRLIAFKREQYRRTGKPDGFRAEWRKRLLHRLMEIPPGTSCRPILSTLYCGGTWVASNLSLQCHSTLHVWFPVFDFEFRRYGPGHVLFFELFRHGHAQGMRWFDFGEGESSYKLKYGGEIYPLWKGVIRRNSPVGCSERMFQSLEWHVARCITRVQGSLRRVAGKQPEMQAQK